LNVSEEDAILDVVVGFFAAQYVGAAVAEDDEKVDTMKREPVEYARADLRESQQQEPFDKQLLRNRAVER
jgi:hypothetical protein